MALMGDVAVRVFASYKTFLRIAPTQKSNLASLVIASCFDKPDDNRFFSLFPQLFPDAICLAVGGELRPNWLPDSAQISYHSWQDSFELSSSVRELQQRLSASSLLASDKLRYQDVVFDASQAALRILPDESAEPLPPKEARIMQLLMSTPGKVLSRDQIKKVVWSDVAVSPRTIDSHISRLRRRLIGAETVIESVYGGGYVLR